MESTHYRKIKEEANRYNDRLLATDPRFLRSVQVHHQDGSVFFFRHAFLMWRGDWIIIFSEHHGVHIYDQDDVDVEEYNPYNISQEQMP